MHDNPHTHPAQKVGPFLPRINDGGILGRVSDTTQNKATS